MRKKMLYGLLVMSLCLGCTFSMTAMAQDPAKIWLRQSPPQKLLDTTEITEQMEIARALAGDDYYLSTTQRLQCNDIDETYTVVQTPGANVISTPPDPMSTGFREAPAVPTKVFDNVYYVGGMEVGGWIIDTGVGYIMLDSSYDYGALEILEPSMAALGLNPADIKYILLTHAGPDHVGAVKYFYDKYGTEIVFNRKLVSAPPSAPVPDWLKNMPAETKVMNDGDTLTLGDTTIAMVHTPRSYNKDGSLGDGFSYFIPVKIKGKRHLWATYGNTGLVGSLADKTLYRESMAKWLQYVAALEPDIAISSHPFVDASLDRMEIIRECDDRNRHGRHDRHDQCGPHNPFLIGKVAARRYFEIMDQCALVQTMRQAAGIDPTGLKCLKVDPNTGKCMP
jgi:metallo-beta-lactamase class B